MLLRRLAVFVGGCSLQAAEVISIALGGMALSVLDGLTSLINKSLLRQPAQGKDGPRLYPFEMIREYALERLAACEELEQTRDAHAAYYLALAEEAESVLPAADQVVWQARLQLEVENLRAAMGWLIERRQIEEALRLATALEQSWLFGDYASEGRGFLEQALEAASESNVRVSTKVKARALRVAGHLVCNQNDPEPAINLFEESDRLSRQIQDKQGTTAALNSLGVI